MLAKMREEGCIRTVGTLEVSTGKQTSRWNAKCVKNSESMSASSKVR
jgi:hypothetical protein